MSARFFGEGRLNMVTGQIGGYLHLLAQTQTLWSCSLNPPSSMLSAWHPGIRMLSNEHPSISSHSTPGLDGWERNAENLLNSLSPCQWEKASNSLFQSWWIIFFGGLCITTWTSGTLQLWREDSIWIAQVMNPLSNAPDSHGIRCSSGHGCLVYCWVGCQRPSTGVHPGWPLMSALKAFP